MATRARFALGVSRALLAAGVFGETVLLLAALGVLGMTVCCGIAFEAGVAFDAGFGAEGVADDVAVGVEADGDVVG